MCLPLENEPTFSSLCAQTYESINLQLIRSKLIYLFLFGGCIGILGAINSMDQSHLPFGIFPNLMFWTYQTTIFLATLYPLQAPHSQHL